MKKTSLLFAVALAVGFGAGTAAEAQQLRMMTGPQGGAWYPLGGAISNMVSEAIPGVGITVLPGGGVANVQGVQQGAAEFGFGNSISTVDAVNGRPPFEGAADQVCNLATLYPQYFQMVALKESGIATVEDFKGRRLITQPVGNTAEQVIRMILETEGLSYDDMRAVDYVSYSDGVSLMQDGNADVFTLGTTVPSSAIMDLANSRKVTIVPLDEAFIAKLREANPGFSALTIKAGSYPGQDQDVLALGYATHLVARCDVDPELVFQVMNTMWENMGDLQTIAGAMRGLTIKEMGADIGVPLHEGAKRFYVEHGVM